jgi:DNA-binding beta-propeller fold protein YncE
MNDASATKTTRASGDKSTVGRLFVLELSGGRIHSMSPDGSSRKVIAADCHLPDGVAVDVAAGHIYWTNMGVPNLDDGSIERADLDGGNRTVIVPRGITHTPKQIHLEKRSGKLYWSDREGMRVMRANLDGTSVETLVKTGEGDRDSRDATKWCVGITVDPDRNKIYWTQKGPDNSGLGGIYRAGIDIPKGENASTRTDIDLWFDGLPEPIDLELDLESRVLYWTDRGNPPLGNTVNCALVDAPARKGRTPKIVVSDLMEGIGIALDIGGNRMFVTDLGGSVYAARLDGSDKRTLLFAQGNLSGVAYAEIPSGKI